mgnify:CR=1 FL=1
MAKKHARRMCEKCGVSVRFEKYPQHMSNVHGMNLDKGIQRRGRIVIVAAVLIALIGISLSYNLVSKSTPTNSKPPEPSSLGESVAGESLVKIPASEVTASARWHTYDSNGVKVRYFLVKGTDGKIHLATDACDVCYRSKKGYRQAENVMVCNNCGQTFAINRIGTENLSGGCWPSYIPMKIEGDSVVIERSALDQKRFMFQ